MRHVIAVTARARRALPGGYRDVPSAEEVSEEPLLPSLAARLGVTVYELRARFAGGPPWALGRVADRREADAICAWLRREGLGALVVDLEALRATLAAARPPLALEGDALRVGGRVVPLAGIRLVVEAMTLVERAQQSVEHRVVGMNARGEPTVVDVTSVRYAKDRQRVLYVFADGDTALRVPQELARAAGFAGPTSLARFEALRAAVLARMVGGRYDPRFVDAPRKRTSFALTVLDAERNTQRSDNVDETNLAAWILHRAMLEGQRVG